MDPAYPKLPAEAFVLVLQTTFQLELFNKFASTIVCFDSTHKTNCHSFKLITVIVPDEYGEGNYAHFTARPLHINPPFLTTVLGMPAAWCIADREDTTVMELFLGSIHSRCPSVGVRTIMTDDGKGKI